MRVSVFLLMRNVMGMRMAKSKDFTLMPAHAHLNLLGWVTMAIYGTFYALTRRPCRRNWPGSNYVCAALGVAMMIPSLLLAIFAADTGNDARNAEPGRRRSAACCSLHRAADLRRLITAFRAERVRTSRGRRLAARRTGRKLGQGGGG